MEIEEYLLGMGIKPRYKGFDLLVYAIKLCQKRPSYLHEITTSLYPDMAEDLNITTGQAERNMRYAIRDAGIKDTTSEFLSYSILDLKLKRKNKEK